MGQIFVWVFFIDLSQEVFLICLVIVQVDDLVQNQDNIFIVLYKNVTYMRLFTDKIK